MSTSVGQALEAIPDGAVKLVRIRLGVSGAVSGLHPFKIYLAPGETDADAWRKICVRSGLIFEDSSTGYMPTGTDEVDDPYSSEEVNPPLVFWTLDDDELKVWVWIELGGATGVADIHVGADPTMDGWDDFPATDGQFIPIGYVDTHTKHDDKVAMIRQFVTADLFLGAVPIMLCPDSKNYLVRGRPAPTPPPPPP